jgi:predicted helicase
MVPRPESDHAAVEEISRWVKVARDRLIDLLATDLTMEKNRKVPLIVDHYIAYKNVVKGATIELYADALAQAFAFHELLGYNRNDSLSQLFEATLGGVTLPRLAAAREMATSGDGIDTFHETFMRANDPQAKKRRGVFYTPQPVIKFIVRSTDELVRTQFGIAAGLASPDVEMHDPACGTGAFLAEVFQQIASNRGSTSAAKTLTHLIEDVSGSDVLYPSIVLARSRLCAILANAGIPASPDDLEGVQHCDALADETLALVEEQDPAASRLLVIIGNPPYSVSSSNKNARIETLMRAYKDNLDERNMQPLSDDYIKFIRVAQWRVDLRGRGIVAIITNNSFVYKIIHRCMRESLVESFDHVFVLNLHGNSNIGEQAPGGGSDESVFDIRVGTAIVFLVKTGQPVDHNILYHEIFGDRQVKHAFLLGNTVSSIPFEQVVPRPPNYFFISTNLGLEEEYNQHPSVRDIFVESIIGVKTHRDDFIVEVSKDRLVAKLQVLLGPETDAEIKATFSLRDSEAYIHAVRAILQRDGIQDDLLLPYQYRAFDRRVIYYSPAFVTRDRLRVMRHMLPGGNIALVTTRLLSAGEFTHVFASSLVGDIGLLSSRTSESAYFFPLYVVGRSGTMACNLAGSFLDRLAALYPDGTVDPETVFAYIYAILHHDGYRRRYIDYLKIDFPHVPLVGDRAVFERLASLGRALVDVHAGKTDLPLPPFHEPVLLGTARHDARALRLYLNKSHFLPDVPAATWAFRIGNYPILQKWLRARKGLVLPPRDLQVLAGIVRDIGTTLEIQRAISSISIPFDQPGEAIRA